MRQFLCIPGQPQGKARARTVRQGGKIHSYTPAKTAAYEALVAATYKSSYPGAETLKGPIEIRITAYFKIPESWPIRKKQEALAEIIKPTVRSDFDNLAKAVTDPLNGIAWEDDKQIVDAEIRKRYAVEPRVEVEIWET